MLLLLVHPEHEKLGESGKKAQDPRQKVSDVGVDGRIYECRFVAGFGGFLEGHVEEDDVKFVHDPRANDVAHHVLRVGSVGGLVHPELGFKVRSTASTFSSCTTTAASAGVAVTAAVTRLQRLYQHRQREQQRVDDDIAGGGAR